MQHLKKLPELNANRALGVLCQRSLFRFFLEFWEVIEAKELIPNWHIEEICDELQRIYETWERGESQPDFLLNVPPGSTKSTLVTQVFPAWIWTRDASVRIISSSYAAELSTAHAVKSRDILKSDKFQRCYPGLIKFKNDTDGKTHYKNSEMGERFTTSTNGSVTGMHGDFIINDDPINPEKAASLVELATASRFSSTTLSTRKTDRERTVTIMVMQRLDAQDPSAHWIKTKAGNINHWCLPGQLSDSVKPERLKAKYSNGLMDERRLGPAALDKLKRDLGSRGYACQIQQLDAQQTGGIWQKWFVVIPDHEMPTPTMITGYGTDWDTAYTDKAENAASAFVTSGMYNNRMYIDNLGALQLEFPNLINEMKLHPAPHYIEAKASGKSAKQVLTVAKIVAIEVQVNADKEARAKDATPKVEAQMVCVRASLVDFLYNDEQQGILKFPKGPKADVADTVAQAIIRHLGVAVVHRSRKY